MTHVVRVLQMRAIRDEIAQLRQRRISAEALRRRRKIPARENLARGFPIAHRPFAHRRQILCQRRGHARGEIAESRRIMRPERRGEGSSHARHNSRCGGGREGFWDGQMNPGNAKAATRLSRGPARRLHKSETKNESIQRGGFDESINQTRERVQLLIGVVMNCAERANQEIGVPGGVVRHAGISHKTAKVPS